MAKVKLAEVYVSTAYLYSDTDENTYHDKAEKLIAGGFEVYPYEEALEKRSMIENSHMILSEKQVLQAFMAGVEMTLQNVREIEL